MRRSLRKSILWLAPMLAVAAAAGLVASGRTDIAGGARGLASAWRAALDDVFAHPAGGDEAEGEDEDREPAREDDDAAAEPRVEIVDGIPVLRLDAAARERTGVVTRVLEPVAFTPELLAIATVVDIEPLIALRARYHAARYRLDMIEARLAAARQEHERLLALYREDANVAEKRVQQAEAEAKAQAAELEQARAELAAVREAAAQAWGTVLADWALGGDRTPFGRLTARQEALLLVTLPPGERLPEGIATILIAGDGRREAAEEARYVSPALRADPFVQGETHFFRTPAAGLRSGMRLDAWIRPPGAAASGVIVPDEAVVWAMGRAWAYVELDAAHFMRLAVPTAVEAPGGWFVADGVRAGERIVVAGAQMLYAEEFRWQIQDEDAD